tara:strand:- start:156 stop:380 length:225 start_codon:yes stop_codon:yes gene_type:complete
MIELTLLGLLNFIGGNFCEYKDEGYDTYKALLLAYSDASEEYGVQPVRQIIYESSGFKAGAIAVAAVKCPQHIK